MMTPEQTARFVRAVMGLTETVRDVTEAAAQAASAAGAFTEITNVTEYPAGPAATIPESWRREPRRPETECTCPACTADRESRAPWGTRADPFWQDLRRRGAPAYHRPAEDPEQFAGLRRLLTGAQWRDVLERGRFDLRAQSGQYYRVFCHVSTGNVYRWLDGARFCLTHPSRYAPMSAVLPCQVYLLRYAELEFLARANLLEHVPMGPLPPLVVAEE